MRRSALLIASVVAPALVIAACSSSGNTSHNASNPIRTAGPNAGPIQRGGTLTIAIPDDMRAGGVLQAHDPVDNLVEGSTVFDPLFTVSRTGTPAPALATKAISSDGGKVWVFDIRHGVKFSDGTPFTAQTVKENFAAFANPKLAAAGAPDVANIASADVTGKYTIKFTLKTPDAHLPYKYMDQDYMGKPPFNNLIGTGPYKFVSHQVGSQITFVRNPNYWRGDPPLNKVVFKVIPNPDIATLDLEKGVVDMIPSYLDATSIAQLKSQSGITLYNTLAADNNQAFFDLEKARRGGYKNALDVREGLAYLINTPKLIPPIVGDIGTLSTQPIPPGETGYDASVKAWPYDEAKGEALLAAGGIHKGGTISMYAISYPQLCAVATAFQSVLDSLGYHATLQCVQNEVGSNLVKSYNWDMFFWHNSENGLAVAAYQDMWDIANVPNPPNDVFTLIDPHLQSAINGMAAAPLGSSTYQRLSDEAAQIIVKQQVATIELFYSKVWYAARNNVHGLIANPENNYGILMNAMTTVWMSK